MAPQHRNSLGGPPPAGYFRLPSRVRAGAGLTDLPVRVLPALIFRVSSNAKGWGRSPAWVRPDFQEAPPHAPFSLACQSVA